MLAPPTAQDRITAAERGPYHERAAPPAGWPGQGPAVSCRYRPREGDGGADPPRRGNCPGAHRRSWVRGCDFLHTDENGLIDDFSVMVRPPTRA